MVAATLGFITGRKIYNIDGIDLIVRGIIGGVTIYLLFVLYLTPSKPLDELNDAEININFRMMLKHSVFFYFIFVIFAWALQFVVDAIRYII